MLENFHFIRPAWLLALIPLLMLCWRVMRQGGNDNPWRRVVDAHLLPLLTVGGAQTAGRMAAWLAGAGWIIAVLALADPTWERRAQPMFQTTSARVVVLNLSRSMEATDLKPSRLVRARFKVEDVLAQNAEGQTALIAYAGDAFTVAPLTRDVNTIRDLLKVLEPAIMPVQGSRADLGLLKAGALLQQAGVQSGQILLIADGIDADKVAASEQAAEQLKREGYRVSVLGVGTEQGAPLLTGQGLLLRDADGKVENFRLSSDALRSVARAGGGQYQPITDSGEALSALLGSDKAAPTSGASLTDGKTMGWNEQGPMLAVLLLPLAALAFRRSWLLSLVLLAGVLAPPRPAMASTWDDLWQRPDQQAAQAFADKDYASAAALATDAGRRGSAEYKRGNFKAALDDFGQDKGPDANYNRGNALARLSRYEDAIAAYDQALKKRPGDADAQANKAAVEAMLKQQQQQQAANAQDQKAQDPQKPDQGKNSGKDSATDAGKDQSKGQSKDQSKDQGKGQGQDQGKDQGKSGSSSQAGASPDTAQGKGAQPGANPGRETQSAKAGKAKPETSTGTASEAKPAANTAKPADAPSAKSQFADAAKKLAAPPALVGKDASAASGQGAGEAMQGKPAAGKPTQGGASADVQPMSSEEQLAADQWLRRIPDDPGGLLRRKFLYQYRQRAQLSGSDGG